MAEGKASIAYGTELTADSLDILAELAGKGYNVSIKAEDLPEGIQPINPDKPMQPLDHPDEHLEFTATGEPVFVQGSEQPRGGIGIPMESLGASEELRVLVARVAELEENLQRVTNHINREIGVAQDTPLCMRLAKYDEYFAKIKELTKLIG